MLDGLDRDVVERRLVIGPGQGCKHLGFRPVLDTVEVAGPGPEVAARQPLGQPLPGTTVGDRGDGHDPVGQAAAVGQVEVPEQPGIVTVSEGRHPAVAVGGLEGLGLLTHHRMELVDEEHATLPGRRPDGQSRRARSSHAGTARTLGT